MIETYVTTVIADPDITALEPQHIEAVQASIPEGGGKILEVNNVERGQVVEFTFASDDANYVHSKIEETLDGLPVDAVTQNRRYRQKKLLISDMDSTMITCECIDELADFAGLKPEVARITEKAMNGEMDFKEALRARVSLLMGLDVSTLEAVYQSRVKAMPGALELITAAKLNGCHTVLVSGGFGYFTSRVARQLGFDEHYGNELEVMEGKLTGRVKEPIMDKEFKLNVMFETCRRLNIMPSQVVALGDGANDLPMLLAAGLGIAYHAKPITQKAARSRLNHNNLSAVIGCLGWV